MNTDKSQNAVAIREEQFALVPTNPSVQQVARHLRWKPETAIRRIQKALPSVLEQQIYLAIVPAQGESGLLPESLAKLLRLYLGKERLKLESLTPPSNRLGKNRFDSFVEFLGECLNILKIVGKEYPGFSLKIEHAGMIVLHYGKEDPERLIEMVDCNLEEMCEVLDISNSRPYSERMRVCLWMVVTKIIPMNHRNGSPDLLDITDFLNMTSVKRHALRRALSQEVPDYLSADQDQLKRQQSLSLLRDEGII